MDADTLDLWLTATNEARAHARCGPKARCRVDRIADVDALIDTIREMAVSEVQDVGAGAEHGG